MGRLDDVERRLEKIVRGVFSRGGGRQVEPVEIASALRREMDHKAIALTEGRTITPNVFDARLSDADFEKAQEWGTPLAEELCEVVIKHAQSQGYALLGPVRFSFRHDPVLRTGVFEIDSKTEKQQNRQRGQRGTGTGRAGSRGGSVTGGPWRAEVEQKRPVLEIHGQRYSLNAPTIVLGRSSEADILVDDTGVSRKHLQIHTQDGQSEAVDLGSTNGSYVNGQKIVGSAPLADGSVISMGRTKITFRLLPPRDGGH
ncbi:phosphopeptide-binding protein [Tersicoccus solisilvae]|uniref:Phosphopeptide-binding protein n=1 Tax=Tersicoccus solisilvae TaxID=1882339 RepID=A0ABQ1NJU4_9MICC|nr:DUF3662 and FHA domain-containing protein [Tersicoccus solisilvae]GGC78591.1 phosphopeptide-binding protein [Tersicoccus solisilvae]